MVCDQVVSVLAFNFIDPSSNSAKIYSFHSVGETGKKQKEAEVGPFQKTFTGFKSMTDWSTIRPPKTWLLFTQFCWNLLNFLIKFID